MLTAVKDELQLDELHVNELRVNRLMGDTHSHMLHLDQITLQRVVEPLLEDENVGDLVAMRRCVL